MKQFSVLSILLLILAFGTPSLATLSLQEEGYDLKDDAAQDEIQKAKEAIVVGDYATALNILEPLAQNGNPVAQLNLGVMYRRGHGVERDDAKGVWLYKLSAAQGNAGAQFNLGAVLYNEGNLSEMRSAAVESFTLAAKQGHEPSRHVLDMMFKTGLDAAKREDFDTALREWGPLAENGSAQAQINLGTMYSKGEGVGKNLTTAFSWYLKAAKQGIMKAQFMVGQMYQDGEGTEKKPLEALNWFLRSAKQGDTNSQVIISTTLALGEVVKRDVVGALFWAYAAEIEGSEDSSAVVIMLEKALLKKIAPSKLEKILEKLKESARECVKKNYEGCGL
jgi:hypothetical protein